MKNTAGKFILKNFVKMVLLIFAVSIAAFALMTVSPVDPLQANVGHGWSIVNNVDQWTWEYSSSFAICS